MAQPKVAIAWLKKEDWARWQKIDPDLPPYAQWLVKIESVMKMLRHRGQEFEKIALDPGAFISWRATNWRGRPEAGAARSAYAAAILAGQAVSRHRSDSRP